MKKPLFYSLPPAGQKVPLKVLLSCLGITSLKNRDRSMEAVQQCLGNANILYLSSGRAALWLFLRTVATMRPRRKEVVIPAYTCPSIVSAVLKAGLTPVLCDNNLEDLGFLFDELQEKVGDKTLAVIVVYLYGIPVDIDRIQTLCQVNEIFLVEDAAQAFGNTFPETPDMRLGLAGDAGFFSFGRGKPISILHGGILTLKSNEFYKNAINLYERINGCSPIQGVQYFLSLGLYSLFSNPRLYWLPQKIPSLNLGGTVFEPEFEVSRGNDLAIALAGQMIELIEKDKKIRGCNAKWYSDNLKGYQSAGTRLAPDYPYLRYPLLIDDVGLRNRILEILVAQGTGATGSYPTPLNELPKLNDVLMDSRKYNNAKKISTSIVTLPVHSGVKEADREKIVRVMRQVSHAN